ncbi:MAG: DUF4365 domain-containing protein [Promethearchaeota archaeon]
MNKRLKEAIHRQALWKAYDGKCFYCGNFIPTILQLEEEHIIPQTYKDKPKELEEIIEEYGLCSDFDIDEYYNRVPSEKGCNRKKGSKLHTKVSIHFYLNTAKEKVESVKSIEKILERKAQANDDLFKTGFNKESLEKFLNLIEEDDPQMSFMRTIFSEWICVKFKPEDGLDYLITILENELEKPNFFFMRLKTDSIDLSNESINFGDTDVKNLKFYLELNAPVFFILCDDQSQKAYWVNIHRYCYEELDVNEPNWRLQEHIKIRIPKENELIDKGRIKEEVTHYSKIIMRKITDSFSWSEGYEDILYDAKKFNEQINENELKAIKSRFHQSLLWFTEDNLEGMREQYEKIYNMKRKDEEHLKAILAILRSANQFFLFEPEKYRKLSIEGFKLAQELENDIYVMVFSFYQKYIDLFGWVFQKLQLMLVEMNNQKGDGQISEISERVRNLQENEVNQNISQLKKEINDIMGHLLRQKKIYEHIILLFTYLQLDFITGDFLRQAGKSELAKQKLSKNENFYLGLLDFLESLGDNDLLLLGKLKLGFAFKQFDQKRAREIYNSGLEIAKQLSHKYFIKLFTQNLSDIGQQILPPINMNTPLSDVINRYKTDEQLFIDTLGSQMLDMINNVFRDLDPLPFLNYCKKLVVAYYFQPGMFFGLYSAGTKRLGCSLQRLCSRESDNLSILAKEFIRNNCLNCELKEPREEQFDPPFRIIYDMLIAMRKMENQ